MEPITDIVPGVLITWRVTHLLHSEIGPFEVFARIRDLAGISYDEFSQPVASSEFGKALLCFWCTSLWVGVATALVLKKNPLRGIAYSGGAILIEVNRGTNGTSHN
jgi:hypothetical protein